MGIFGTIQEFWIHFRYPGSNKIFQQFYQTAHDMVTTQANRELAITFSITASTVTTLLSRRNIANWLCRKKTQFTKLFLVLIVLIDVLIIYLTAIPLKNGSADTIFTEFVKIFFHHSYLSKTFLSYQGTNFHSKLMAEIPKLLEVELQLATLKHPQTVRSLKRSLAAYKWTLTLN